jgi:hypothetical protein
MLNGMFPWVPQPECFPKPYVEVNFPNRTPAAQDTLQIFCDYSVAVLRRLLVPHLNIMDLIKKSLSIQFFYQSDYSVSAQFQNTTGTMASA